MLRLGVRFIEQDTQFCSLGIGGKLRAELV